jgi:hypothetical protein
MPVGRVQKVRAARTETRLYGGGSNQITYGGTGPGPDQHGSRGEILRKALQLLEALDSKRAISKAVRAVSSAGTPPRREDSANFAEELLANYLARDLVSFWTDYGGSRT